MDDVETEFVCEGVAALPWKSPGRAFARQPNFYPAMGKIREDSYQAASLRLFRLFGSMMPRRMSIYKAP
jgi:hypothetical protein